MAATPVADPSALRTRVREWRAAGERVALVPTMGDLHAGHLALVDAAVATADRVVASVFVNPLQFGPGEDYAEYPRMPERDCTGLLERGADVVFMPAETSLYPDGPVPGARIVVPGLEDTLCGADRPGHFSGVATVVTKLFNIVEPEVALFGEKDYQQLLIIRRVVRDLGFAIEVVGVPTVREPDGLALSSRNRYLDDVERNSAPMLYATLQRIAGRLEAGERDRSRLEADGWAELEAVGFDPSYVAIRRAADLMWPTGEERPRELRVLAAARLGRARLIDNVPVGGQ